MRFAYKFIIYFSIFTVMSLFLEEFFVDFFMFFIGPTAKLIGATIISNQISVKGNFLLVAKECTGMQIYSMFLAFALSYKFSRKNINIIFISLVGLFFLNYIRIISLIGIAGINFGLFKILHGFLWPASFFIFTLIGVIYYKNEADKKTD